MLVMLVMLALLAILGSKMSAISLFCKATEPMRGTLTNNVQAEDTYMSLLEPQRFSKSGNVLGLV